MSMIFITVERLAAILRSHGISEPSLDAVLLEAQLQTAPAVVGGVATTEAVARREQALRPVTGEAANLGPLAAFAHEITQGAVWPADLIPMARAALRQEAQSLEGVGKERGERVVSVVATLNAEVERNAESPCYSDTVSETMSAAIRLIEECSDDYLRLLREKQAGLLAVA